MTLRYVQGIFVKDYDPTIEDAYRKSMMLDDKNCVLDILDTAGQEDYTVRNRKATARCARLHTSQCRAERNESMRKYIVNRIEEKQTIIEKMHCQGDSNLSRELQAMRLVRLIQIRRR